jgi:hypothetical protein
LSDEPFGQQSRISGKKQSCETYQYRLTRGNMYVMELTSTVWHLTTYTSWNLPVPPDTWQHGRRGTYQCRLTLGNMHFVELASTAWHLATRTSWNLPVPSDTWQHARRVTYQYRLTLGNMHVVKLTSTVWNLATCTSCKLPVPSDTWQHVRHATYQNHLEGNDTHDELTAEEVEQKQRAEHGVQILNKPEAKWACWYQWKMLWCRFWNIKTIWILCGDAAFLLLTAHRGIGFESHPHPLQFVLKDFCLEAWADHLHIWGHSFRMRGVIPPFFHMSSCRMMTDWITMVAW